MLEVRWIDSSELPDLIANEKKKDKLKLRGFVRKAFSSALESFDVFQKFCKGESLPCIPYVHDKHGESQKVGHTDGAANSNKME